MDSTEESYTLNSELNNPKQEINSKKSRYLGNVNLYLEKDIQTLKQTKKSKFKRKLNILKSSYLLTYKSLSPKKVAIFWISLFLGIIFLLFGINKFNNRYLINIPTYGGTWNEGVIGIPRYVNPVLATSDADRDLSKLIFSGLLKKDKDGNLENDLASSIEESADGLTYTVGINPKARFSDGEKLTSEDILFTFSKIKDQTLNSPLAINFEGVTLEEVDKETVIFHLKKPFIYFKENLTFGILPKHILVNLSNDQFLLSDFNVKPVGTGAFQVEDIVKNNDNTAREYELIANQKYLHGRAFLDAMNIYIYENNEDLLKAVNDGTLDATSYLDRSYFQDLKNSNSKILTRSLPNIFMLSLNPNKNQELGKKSVRLFLAKAINKDELIKQVFNGYAVKKDGFFRNNTSLFKIEDSDTLSPGTTTVLELTTADVGDLKEVAQYIQAEWVKVGVQVKLKIYNLNDIRQVIRDRDFQILLFGSIIKNDLDLYAYWHSSQKIYPGTNITGYTSKNLDDNLEILRNSTDNLEREKALINTIEELSKELPAIPLYSNNLNYLIRNVSMANMLEDKIPKYLSEKSERFTDASRWSKEEESVWRFSYQKNLLEKLTNLMN